MLRVLCRGATVVLTGMVVLALAGCAGVPKAQLQAYSSAYDELQSAAALVYADAAPALSAGNPANAPQFPDTLGSPTFDRHGCGAVVASIDSLRARCHALVAAKAYNQALLDLSAGGRVDDALSLVDSALASLTTLGGLLPVPGAAPAIATLNAVAEPLKAILGEALKARDRAALLDALLRGEPQLRALMAALRSDVDSLYAVQRTFAEQGLQKNKNDIDRDLNAAFSQVANHAAPKDPAVAASLALLQDKFESTFSASEPRPGHRLKEVGFSGTAAAAPFDQASLVFVERQLLAAAEDVARFKATGARYQASAQALEKFDALIAAWGKSLTDVISASRQPFSQGGGVEQALLSLTAVRDQARDIKRILEARKGH
ncbi:MAG TPA: hypothetical protein H9903_17410 [Candidatus Aquabacterium excrementipullorum]|nr:hypothetical protein [Candidatus Aquabacterium excrementipullorum]